MLERLLASRSVAVVGASPTNRVALNLLSWARAMDGPVRYWPVNPKYREVAGLTAYASLEDLPDVPDAVVVALGGGLAAMVEQAEAIGAGAVVVYADLRQAGAQAAGLGARLRSKGIAMVGSNCVGALSVRRGLALYSGDVNSRVLEAGPVGFVSQSGSVLIGMLATAPRLRLSSVFSVGNEDATTASDYVAFLAGDEETRIIGCFLETIRDPAGFRDAVARAAGAGKPVVVLTVGKSAQAKENAATHSGALAPDSAVMSAFLRDCGAIEAQSLEALVETLVAFQCRRRPAGNAVGMVHVSGGEASLQLDFGARNGLAFPPLAPASVEALRRTAPWVLEPQNPLDAWGATSYTTTYPPALAVLAGDPGIDMLVANQDVGQYVGDPGPHVARTIGAALVASSATHDKPLFMVSNLAAGHDDELLASLNAAGIPLLTGADAGYTALGHWYRFHGGGCAPSPATAVAGGIAAPALPASAGALDEVRSMELLGVCGLRAPKLVEVRDAEEAVRAAERIGFPVVVKGAGETLLHKTETGSVVTGVRSADQVREAVLRIAASAPAGAVTSFIVVEQIERHRELMLGAHRDGQLGTVILLGVGGVMAEIIADVQMAMAPVSPARAREMIAGLRSAAWLGPWRHLGAADADSLVEAVVSFSHLVGALGERMDSIDVNPLAVLEKGAGCVMLDAVVVLR